MELWVFIGSVVVASLSYSLKNFTLDPLISYKKVVGRIRNRTIFYANIYGSKINERHDAAHSELRQLSCDLDEAYYAIGLRCMLVLLRAVPNPKRISSATHALIGLSNNTHNKNLNHDEVEKIKNKLYDALNIVNE